MDYYNVKTCERCGRLFESFLESKHCKECMRLLEERLDSVKRFLEVHDTASMEEVAVALKTDRKQIISWMRENRLSFPEEAGVTIPCVNCGSPIHMGKYCAICKAQLKEDLESVLEKPQIKSAHLRASEKNHMHFLHNRRR